MTERLFGAVLVAAALATPVPIALANSSPPFGVYAEPAPSSPPSSYQTNFVNTLMHRLGGKVTVTGSQLSHGIFIAPARTPATRTHRRTAPPPLRKPPLVTTPAERAGLGDGANAESDLRWSLLGVAAGLAAVGLLLHLGPSGRPR